MTISQLAPERALRRLELTVVRRLEGYLHGEHLGLLPGPGTELAEAREYQVGDDVRRMSVDPPQPRQVLKPETIMELQRSAEQVFVHNLVAEYAVRLVMATRTPSDFHLPDLEPIIELGVSPRATLGLVSAGRALALIHGRDYVLPTDVQAVARDVMAHRIVLGFDAVADNIAPAQVVDRILAMVPPPTPVWNAGQPNPNHQPQQQPSAVSAAYPPPVGPPRQPDFH